MSWCRGLPPHLHAPTHNTARTPPHANISALTGNVVLLLLRIHENNTPHNEQSEQHFHQSVIPPTYYHDDDTPTFVTSVLQGTTLTNAAPHQSYFHHTTPHRPRHHLYLADPPQNSATPTTGLPAHLQLHSRAPLTLFRCPSLFTTHAGCDREPSVSTQ